ncbi:MAG: mannitol-1-phosphate 5-dehydrogenase [Eubacteriales bacterium]|jgi:mannitol-1-phosphate 5-dehydrogenase
MNNKKAVIYGGGNIGRGFVGQLFYLSGYETVFVDVADWLVDSLNREKGYNIVVIDNDKKIKQRVENVRAVNGKDMDAAAAEIAECEIMATAVGVNVLPRIAPVLAKGIEMRFQKRSSDPLNIIICENLIDADKFLQEQVRNCLPNEIAKRLDDYVGFIEASVGRMVPIMTDEMKREDPLAIRVEPFCELPVDRNGYRGNMPNIKNIEPRSNFGFYIRRKLFLHNLGHASCAYLGADKGYTYIYEAIADPEILETVRAAMYQSSKALQAEYSVPIEEIIKHADDLISRFGNTGLRDTVERVARDPMRKLMSDDRLLGAALLCIKHSLPYDAITHCIRCALEYNNIEDPSAVKMQSIINENGLKSFLVEHCGLTDEKHQGASILLDEIL